MYHQGWDAQGRVGRGLWLQAPVLSSLQCILTGRWVNDLGSNMTITNVNAKSVFTGIYYTSATMKKTEESPLQGFQHLPNLLSQPTFGFTIHWSFSDSITVFTGQCFVDDNGKEVLKTMWLLRPHADKLKNNRNATL
ncbi:avidin-like [Corvus moneduloides]|uniref:avidin-like n=1 Tax=Corvus moneduloides TaxID=1196302 RepID=UPI0013621B71|nr:avidin-like [Corvus moneduloides]